MLNLTDAQKTCPHVFIGRADGVHCTRCGLHLTPQQYHELLHPPEGQQDAADAAPDKKRTHRGRKARRERGRGPAGKAQKENHQEEGDHQWMNTAA